MVLDGLEVSCDTTDEVMALAHYFHIGDMERKKRFLDNLLKIHDDGMDVVPLLRTFFGLEPFP